MKCRNRTVLICLMFLVSIFAAGCADRDTGAGKDSEEGGAIEAEVPQYKLPLKTSDIANYEAFSEMIKLEEENPEALKKLEENGFVVLENPYSRQEEDITSMYGRLKQEDVPIFITTDSLLHLYHIQFDETLRQVEEREFYDAIWEVDLGLLEASVEEYENSSGEVKEAARRNAAYFAVALSLLQPQPEQIRQPDQFFLVDYDAPFPAGAGEKYNFEVPSFVEKEVEAELELIEAHSGFALSPLFKYGEDYSQYLPRGHYTRSETLKNYFKAIMWHGRMSMLLKEDLIESETPEKDARIQTMQASLIAANLKAEGLKTEGQAEKEGEVPELLDKWDRIYTVTAFYVGFSDDLGPYEYMEAMASVFGSEFRPEMLDEESVGELKTKLAEYKGPKIYGGTGACVLTPLFSPEQADECLADTGGFRFMGQRFIPDSYMFSNLVEANSGEYKGKLESGVPEPFTSVLSGSGRPIRGFPRGLDVMALLGSDRAVYWLDELDDSNYEKYSMQYEKLDSEFEAFDEVAWKKNLYWTWLYSLKPLLENYGEGYPTFMQTGAWQDKELTTSLASWTELRHDTILYAKQCYIMMDIDMIGKSSVEEKNVVGYVEPVPEFYARLLDLTRTTNRGLEERDVLTPSSKARLANLELILEKLRDISEKELENEELTEEDYAFIRDFGEQLEGVIEEVEDESKKTTIIADVYTESNTGTILEEGVGYVDMLVVAYRVPDGRILLGAGPVFSYYEFKQPMAERLTDEKWRKRLEENPPERPGWTSSYIPE